MMSENYHLRAGIGLVLCNDAENSPNHDRARPHAGCRTEVDTGAINLHDVAVLDEGSIIGRVDSARLACLGVADAGVEVEHHLALVAVETA